MPKPAPTNGTEEEKITDHEEQKGFPRIVILPIVCLPCVFLFLSWKWRRDDRKKAEEKLVCERPRVPGEAFEMQLQSPGRAVVRGGGHGNAGEDFPGGCAVL